MMSMDIGSFDMLSLCGCRMLMLGSLINMRMNLHDNMFLKCMLYIVMMLNMFCMGMNINSNSLIMGSILMDRRVGSHLE